MEAKDEHLCTPLHLACKKGSQECVELLLRKGANIMALDNRQWLSLHYALYNKHPKAVYFLFEFEAYLDKLSQIKNSQGRIEFIISKDDRVKKSFDCQYKKILILMLYYDRYIESI